MNQIIAICVLISFCVSFTLLFLLVTVSEEITLSKKIENFYSQDLETDKKNLFLIGSSYVGTLNTTLINEKISLLNKNYEIYNLAITSDHPEKRIQQIEEIISMKPEMVIYGVSFYAFQSEIKKNSNILPEIPGFSSLTESEIESFNPKLITLQSFRKIFVENGIWPGSDSRYFLPNTPFFSFGSSGSKILNEEQLARDALGKSDTIQNVRVDHDSNPRLLSFKQMIKQLNDNEIKVLIFVPPLHENYIDLLPDDTKNSFKIILNEISDEFDIEIIDLLHNYKELDVWRDLTHISYNKKSMIYSEDIVNVIVEEIKK